MRKVVTRTFSLLFTVSFLLLLASSALAASDFSITFQPEQDTILLNETAEFQAELRNFGDARTFQIYSTDVAWSVSTDPPEDRLLTVPKNGVRTTTLRIKPLYVNPGYYVLPLVVRPIGSNSVERENVLIGVNSPSGSRDYEPAVRVTTRIDKGLDPRTPITVAIDLDNRNRKELDTIQVRIVSELFSQEHFVSLGPLERKTITFQIALDPQTAPQDVVVRTSALLTTEERTYRFDAEPQTVRILQVGDVDEDVSVESSFLKRTSTVTLENNANIPVVHIFRYPKSFFSGLFTSTEPNGRVIHTDEGVYYEWEQYYNVGEVKEVTIRTSYRPILWVILLAVAITLLYYFLRSPVVVKKSAMVIEKREGGISDVKVLIELRNRSNRPVRYVTLIDKVPGIVSLSKKFEMGTLHPSKIVNDSEGNTLIKWGLEELDAFEERVMSYKFRSKYSILGGLHLPVSIGHFLGQTGKKRSTRSNISQIGFGKQ